MNVKDLREYAKALAQEQKVTMAAVKELSAKSARLRAAFTNDLERAVNDPNADVDLEKYLPQLEALETETNVNIQRSRALIRRVNDKNEDLQSSMEKYDVNRLDPTSVKLLFDTVTSYTAEYFTLIFKMLCLVVLMVAMKKDLKLILGAYVVVYIVWYITKRLYMALSMKTAGEVVKGTPTTESDST
jgi:hypothetical protein